MTFPLKNVPNVCKFPLNNSNFILILQNSYKVVSIYERTANVRNKTKGQRPGNMTLTLKNK